MLNLRVSFLVAVLCLTVSPIAFADLCESLVSKDLAKMDAGNFEHPKIGKDSDGKGSAEYQKQLAEIKQTCDKVVSFGAKEKPKLEACYIGGKMAAYGFSHGDTKELFQLNAECKINKIAIDLGGVNPMFLTAQMCHDLPAISNIVARTASTNFNQFALKCREQGGSGSGDCRCPNGSYISPYDGTCFKERVIPKYTDVDKLRDFAAARGGVRGSPDFDPENYQRSLAYCKEHEADLAPVLGSVKEQKSDTVGAP